jgi:hypothetical protein
MLWGILGIVAALMLIAVLFQQLRPLHAVTDPHHGSLDFEARRLLLDDAPIPDDAKEAILKPFPARVSQEVVASDEPTSEELGDDSRLRVFDEL